MRNPTLSKMQLALGAAPLLAAAAAILGVRFLLGFQFPVPWPDETGFVAPGFDFARTGSFFDAGMNPDRVVMWMPPGYMLLLAATFRAFGYSYALARFVSTLACLACLCLVARLAWRWCAGWRRNAALWVVAFAFLAPAMLIDANIARMEMVFAATMLLALSASVRERLYVALAWLAAGGLIHFNAIYFAPPLLLAFAVQAIRHRLRGPTPPDYLALAASAFAWLLYAMYVARNWTGFVADMKFQFALKKFISYNDPAHSWWPVGLACALACPSLASADSASLVALFGVAFVAMAHGGHEIWYDYGQPLGFALIAVALFAGVDGWTRTVWPGVAAGAFALVMALRVTPLLASMLPDVAMVQRDIVAPSEILRVRGFIATLKPGATVDFGFGGMELFFLDDLARAGARWTIARHSVTQLQPFRPADWRVVCDSREWPRGLLAFDMDHPRRGVDSGCAIFPGVRPAAHG